MCVRNSFDSFFFDMFFLNEKIFHSAKIDFSFAKLSHYYWYRWWFALNVGRDERKSIKWSYAQLHFAVNKMRPRAFYNLFHFHLFLLFRKYCGFDIKLFLRKITKVMEGFVCYFRSGKGR